ncbi:MarR family winged helix-turn-helix transcriptional regulator [Pisciglobus halotolerans]|uniref:DNA-binding transcriptional regulator, MarR family n=1 Tax=Pisciglobus halotolerans TaxID=745365 RepID=A0A1I3ASK7_9LACT|nr:MarR family winged helix-turn-helix transcriptional regulator [Pisciglobus halotolerans]SFH52766.1 DNA-binding transcriptional regulator, MarR family [Pisciglobus halotolerans]
MREHTQSVSFSLQATSNQVKRTIAKKMAEVFGNRSNLMQHQIIGYIQSHQQEDIFQKDIEELLTIRRSTATGILNTLEKRGLIHREPVSYDARLKKLAITSKGVEFEKKAVGCMRAVESQVRAGLTDEELAIFFRVLSKIRSNINEND